MTVIVAFKESDGTVHMASESRSSWGGEYSDLSFPKINKTGRFLYGCAGDPVQQQLFDAYLPDIFAKFKKKPLPTDDRETVNWFVRNMQPWLIDILDRHDSRPPEQVDKEHPFNFILAFHGQILSVTESLGVDIIQLPYVSTGSGAPVANGAFHALAEIEMDPEQRVRTAVAAACAHVSSCGGRIDYLRT